jgi:hypothetical protein
MNVFQNILDIFIVEQPYEGYIISAHKTEAEAKADAARVTESGEESFATVRPAQATNINGKWHLLGNIINP